jgi:hypothetical protein
VNCGVERAQRAAGEEEQCVWSLRLDGDENKAKHLLSSRPATFTTGTSTPHVPAWLFSRWLFHKKQHFIDQLVQFATPGSPNSLKPMHSHYLHWARAEQHLRRWDSIHNGQHFADDYHKANIGGEQTTAFT